MPANARSMKQSKLPTLEDVDSGKVTLDEYEVAHGEDIPEWTAEDFARSRTISDFPELTDMFERARGQRGPQKSPTKERVGLRLDQRRASSISARPDPAGRAASTRCWRGHVIRE